MRIDPSWLSGFVDGEGTFFVGLNKSDSLTLGFQVLPEFRIVQHGRDAALLYAIRTYFGHGQVVRNRGPRAAAPILEYRVRALDALARTIVPFFERYPLRTQKRFDFLLFRRVVRLMAQGKHLTPEGLAAIRVLKGRMNRSARSRGMKI